ncbi:MAG TPA: hypothetical protein V6C90_02340, partial [Coleofasciculaceae cyanobacterium]
YVRLAACLNLVSLELLSYTHHFHRFRFGLDTYKMNAINEGCTIIPIVHIFKLDAHELALTNIG